MKGNGEKSKFETLNSKIEHGLLFLFLLLIPTQLGRHFWPEWSLVRGVRVDYLSPTLYLVDIIWSLWIMTKIFNLKFKNLNWKNVINFQNILIGSMVVVNILIAGNKWVAIYKWLRVGQWVGTYTIVKSQKSKVKRYLMSILPCWIGIESLLGVAQVIKSGSLQGIFYWLGERSFEFTGIGVAQMSIIGNGIVRAYGTFSHPNSLAGFLLVSMLLWSKIHPLPPPLTRRGLINNRIFYWVVWWLGVVGIIVTGSRTVWGVSLATLIIYNLQFIINNFKLSLGRTAVLLGVIMIVLGMIGINYKIGDFVGGWDSESLSKRVSLNVVGTKMWSENFLLGVGLGNFIPKMMEYQGENRFYWLQPIHNIFLLAGVEIGMLGVILVIKFIIFNLKFLNIKKNWVMLGAIVIMGMVDHYWITLPQNSWLLCVVLGIL